RGRRASIPRLAGRFLEAGAGHYGRPPVDLTPAAEQWLVGQPWPGNVRQLRQTMERALVLSQETLLDVGDLEAVGEVAEPARAAESLPPVGTMTIDEIERAM